MLASTNVRQITLLVVPLLMCATGATLHAQTAQAATPTCRGVPATIVGTARDDTLRGTSGNDVIVGLRGLDEIDGRGGADLICGGPSRYKEIDGDVVFQNLFGGPGNDTVVGGLGVDEVFGDAGTDLVIGAAGHDFLGGGLGNDTLRAGAGLDFVSGDEGSDRMFGDAGADWLNDFAGANVLNGGDGPDELSSGPGNEMIRGGPGRDAVSYVEVLEDFGSGSHCNTITANLALGTAHGTGFGTDTLESLESVWTGGGNDVLTGNGRANGFYTGGFPCAEASPTDSVNGMGGADRISFDSESAEGGSAPGPVRVDLAAGTARWNNQGSPNPIVVSLTSIENVTGTEYRDIIAGDAQPNGLNGGTDWGSFRGDVIGGAGGNDRLAGQGGSDELYGGPGADVLWGGPGSDFLQGGLGLDRNDGGRAVDTCRSPAQGRLVSRCER
jgi:Ca2+-binding RTX toxin-like protein